MKDDASIERSCIQKRALSLFTEVQTSCAGDRSSASIKRSCIQKRALSDASWLNRRQYVPLETSFTIWLAEQTSVLTAVVNTGNCSSSGPDRSMAKVLQMG